MTDDSATQIGAATPDERRAALRALQGLSLEEAIDLLLELGVLDATALMERREAQERRWRLTSAEVLGDELEALRRQARHQRRQAEALARESVSQRTRAVAAGQTVPRLDERRRELLRRRRQGGETAATLEATHRALAAALAAGRLLEDAAEPALPAVHAPRVPGEPGLDIGQEATEEGLELVLAGEIDIATAPALNAALERALHAGAPAVVVDLTLVRFMDSTGIAALLAARRALPAGTELAIVCPPGPCLRVLELTGLPQLLEVRPARAL
jgi:anti-sigma B factor antagonist